MNDRGVKTVNGSTPLPRRRWWRRALLLGLLVYAGWCTILYFGQERLLFRRDIVPPVPHGGLAGEWSRRESLAIQPSDHRPERLNIDISTGGTVYAWFVPGSDAAPPAPLAVLFHGNAHLADHMSWFVLKYQAMGCAVLVPEYRGYGGSAGSPSQEGIVSDAIRFYDAAAARPDVDRTRVVFHGISLGGGVAAQVAAKCRPTALILESSFSSVAVMARRYLVPEMLVRNPFRTDEVLPALDHPVLIVHGSNDTIVPVWHARRLRELGRKVTYCEYECGHNDLPPLDREAEHWERVRGFLAGAGVLRENR